MAAATITTSTFAEAVASIQQQWNDFEKIFPPVLTLLEARNAYIEEQKKILDEREIKDQLRFNIMVEEATTRVEEKYYRLKNEFDGYAAECKNDEAKYQNQIFLLQNEIQGMLQRRAVAPQSTSSTRRR